jgi:hypothetical protein
LGLNHERRSDLCQEARIEKVTESLKDERAHLENSRSNFSSNDEMTLVKQNIISGELNVY